MLNYFNVSILLKLLLHVVYVCWENLFRDFLFLCKEEIAEFVISLFGIFSFFYFYFYFQFFLSFFFYCTDIDGLSGRSFKQERSMKTRHQFPTTACRLKSLNKKVPFRYWLSIYTALWVERAHVRDHRARFRSRTSTWPVSESLENIFRYIPCSIGNALSVIAAEPFLELYWILVA